MSEQVKNQNFFEQSSSFQYLHHEQQYKYCHMQLVTMQLARN